MKLKTSHILSWIFGLLLLGVIVCCFLFYDVNTGTINLGQQQLYTQNEYDENYDNGYTTAENDNNKRVIELQTKINTLTKAKDAITEELNTKLALIIEYETTHSTDTATIIDLREQVEQQSKTIAILQADIERYIEQINNPTIVTVTATFYLDSNSTDVYYTKVITSGDTLSSTDVPTPENTVDKIFVGWCVSGSDSVLTASILMEDTVYYGKWEKIVTTSHDYHITGNSIGTKNDAFNDPDDFILNNFESIKSLTLNGKIEASFAYEYTDETGFKYNKNASFNVMFDNTKLKYNYGSSTTKYYTTEAPVTIFKTDDELVTKSVKITIILSPKESHEVAVVVWYSEVDNEYSYIDYTAPYDYVITVNI